jgi:isopenicillin-N N-acyltransferase-like protein
MIPQITISGTTFEMGSTFGEAFRDKIHEFAQTRLVRLKQYIKEYCQISITDDDLFSRISALIPYHQNYDATVWSEFDGIAKGANISYENLIMVMGYTDLRDYLTQEIGKEVTDVGGCSAFIIPEENSKQGVLCGQTWDMTVEALNYLVLVHRKPNKGPETVYLTTMGCLGLIGLNSNGIAIGNTNLMAVDNKPGVHYLFTISRALSMDSLDAAVGSVVNTRRLAGHNFFLADATKGVNIEATANLAYCSVIGSQPHIQTNHYLNESLKTLQKDLPKNILVNTDFRYNRMSNHFVSDKIWDVESCWQALSDDTRHELGAAICNEDFNGQFGDFATVATVVLVPKERMMWVCSKGAKSGSVQKINI